MRTEILARTQFVFLAILGIATGAAEGQASRTALIARLDSLAGAPVQERRAVGISVAIVRGADTLLMRGYGKANLEFDVPTPAGAVYEIGSVTKQFTAAAILQLRDAGKLDLDAEFTKYLPTYPTKGRKITVRRLLDHTSGIKGITEIPAFGELTVRSLPRDSAIALFSREPFDFEPGEAMIYNNSAYILLGHIIEKVSGMSYEDYVEQKIFAPLGMKQSHYCSNTEVVPKKTSGYQYAGQTARLASYHSHLWPFSAGSLCASANDLVTWLQALHGGKVLPEKSYREMITPGRLNDGAPLRYAMGLAVGPDVRGTNRISHGGAISGYTADASWYPEEKLAIVVLMNSSGPISPSALASELAGAIIAPKAVNRPFTGDASPLIGTYVGASRGRELTVEIRQGPTTLALIVNGAQPRPLSWEDGWKFRSGELNLVFDRTGTSGPATLLRYDAGGGYYLLRRK
jgi:CubicO group peptidase (beta-lactamase class C family)